MKFRRMIAAFLLLVLLGQTVPIHGFASTVFTDVESDKWYTESVIYVYENGMMNGVSTNSFGPDQELTRAMFVTILGRMAGASESSYTTSAFSDVATGSWYSAYVAWASENGIVNGYGNGLFGTEDKVTREQMATMIARYISREGIQFQDSTNAVSSFEDAEKVSPWAKEGLELMRRTALLRGDGAGNFRPQDNSSRAEAATLFMRLHQAIAGNRQIPEGATDLGDGDSMYQITDANVVLDGETLVRYVNDILLVFLKSNVSWSEKEELAESIGGKIAGDIDGVINILQIRVEEKTLVELDALATQLMQNELVNYASYDVAMLADSVSFQSTATQDNSNDTWWYDAVEAEYVQENYSGWLNPVTVGVIDSGVQSLHSELNGNVSFASPYYVTFNNLLFEDSKEKTGKNLNHGTHVCGIIVAKDDNAGITGIAPNADVVFASFKAPNEPVWNTPLTTIHALNQMIEKGAKVINCSFGIYYYNQAKFNELKKSEPETYNYEHYADYKMAVNASGLEQTRLMAAAMCELIRSGEEFLIVQAAGNGINNSGPGIEAYYSYYWAAMDEITCSTVCEEYGIPFSELEKYFLVVSSIKNSMTSGSYDMDLNRNYGKNVDLCAPGAGIYSTVYDNAYQSLGGTSMAAPMVTAVAALVWSVNADFTAEQVQKIVKENYRYSAKGTYVNETWEYPVVNARLAVETAIVQDKSGKYIEAYKKTLQSHPETTDHRMTVGGKVYTYSIDTEYALYDIDKNGISELIIKEDSSQYYIYTFDGTDAVLCGKNYWTYADCLYKYDGNGLVVHHGGTGSLRLEHVWLYELRSGVLENVETIIDTETSAYDELYECLDTFEPIDDFFVTTDYTLLLSR